VSGRSSLEFYMPEINDIDSTLLQDPSTAGNLFISGGLVNDSADFETKLQLPASFGFGLSYQINDKFLVAFDAEYTMWSKFEGFEFAYSNHEGLTGPADSIPLVNAYLTADVSNPVEWEDAGKVALGIVYDYNDYITFVGGGSADQSPQRTNSMLSPQFIDTGDKYSFSGGLIWHYRQYDFGFVTSYTAYPDLTTLDMVDLNDDGLVDNMNGFYTADSYETVLSFVYRF